MLPPVTAASSSDVAFSNPPSQQIGGTQVLAVDKIAKDNASTAPATLFAKANLASLSSELQFSQNVTVLADAIGKLMKIPRQDGETPSVYVARLVTTITNLAPPQRAALEMQIGRILPGLTLGILVETLKNPTGPQAARLALLLETAPHRGSDLAAKAVVSSYRQNIGPDIGTASPAVRPATVQINPSVANPVNPTSRPNLSGQIASALAQTQNSGQISGNDIRSAPSTTVPTQRMATLRAAAASSGPTKTQSITASPDARANASQIYAGRLAQTAADSTQSVKTNAISVLQSDNMSTPRQKVIASNQLTPATTRFLELRTRFEQTAPQAPPPAANDTKVTRQNADIAAEKALTLTSNPLAALLTALTTIKLPNLADGSQSLFASVFGFAKSSTKDNLSYGRTSEIGLSSELDTLLDELKSLPRGEIQAKLLESLKHLAPDSPQLQALLIAALRNELATAQPYVNYPNADDEYESDHHPRGQWSSPDDEASDEGESNAHHPDDGANGDAEPAPDEINPTAIAVSGSDDENSHDLIAESYYLRMGSFN